MLVKNNLRQNLKYISEPKYATSMQKWNKEVDRNPTHCDPFGM